MSQKENPRGCMDKTQRCLRSLLQDLILWRGGGAWIFFSFFCCSQHVPLKFPMGSHQVLQGVHLDGCLPNPDSIILIHKGLNRRALCIFKALYMAQFSHPPKVGDFLLKKNNFFYKLI